MTRPTLYPWNARLAETKKSAHKLAIEAGRNWRDGAKEWLAFSDLRAEREKKLREREKLRYGRNEPLNVRSSARRRVLKELDEMEIGTGCRFVRALKSKRPITEFNGFGYAVVGYRVSRKEYRSEKIKYEQRQAKLHYHTEVCECPECEGYGLGEWRENRRTGEMYQVRCHRCDGSGRIKKKVRGKGENESLNWDGTLTSTWLANGIIEEDEAARIRANCKYRHEQTDYDDLLASGMSKEDAREQMRER